MPSSRSSVLLRKSEKNTPNFTTGFTQLRISIRFQRKGFSLDKNIVEQTKSQNINYY